MIPTLRFWLSLLGATAFYASWMVLAALFRVRYRPGGVYDRMPKDYGSFMLRVNGIRVSPTGLDRLNPAQSYVYVSNHLSWVDPWALVTTMPGRVRFVAKQELSRIPIFGQALRAGHHIIVDRDDRDAAVKAYAGAAKSINEGFSAVVFAEGTRSRDGTLGEFKKGPFVLAIVAGVPVVPVLVEGTFEILKRGALVPHAGPVRLHIGEPIPTKGLTYEDRERLAEQCREAMLAMGKGQKEKGKGEDGKAVGTRSEGESLRGRNTPEAIL